MEACVCQKFHAVNLLIFMAINFRVLSIECHFTMINFRVCFSSPIVFNFPCDLFSQKFLPLEYE